MNFNRLDLGNINGNCGNDYLAVGAEKLCGDFGTLTAQGTSKVMLFSQLHVANSNVSFNRIHLSLILMARENPIYLWPLMSASS